MQSIPTHQRVSRAVVSTSLRQDLLSKIADRTAKVAVIGLGYVGLPFCIESTKSGFTTFGFDVQARLVEGLAQGTSHIRDVSNDQLQEALSEGRFQPTDDPSVLTEADVIVIAVPTPLTKNLVPDLAAVRAATEAIAKHLRAGQLVTLESTTYPGTTDEVLRPILEAGGLQVEHDFFLAHSPERVDPGNRQFQTHNTSKVVGACGPQSLEVASAFYSAVVETIVPVSSAKAAELVKVYENVFRSVNVGLVNELALLCDRLELNVWEVLDAAFTKPFGIMPFYPGPGVGGHCIPLDPHYLQFKAKEFQFETRFIQLAGEINRAMPRFVVEKSVRILNERGIAMSQAQILVLGVAYKSNIDDVRESPALDIIRLLNDWDAGVIFHDPHVQSINDHGFAMISAELTDDLIESSDLVIIATHHDAFDYSNIVRKAKCVLDTRNATRNIRENREKITLL